MTGQPVSGVDGERRDGAREVVSVVVPCYRLASLLGECVASVVCQTYQKWEIIIVDDGSPDDCAGVAQSLIAANPEREIRLVRQGNEGVARARNRGVQESRGEYVLPLDADDLLDRRFLARTVEALQRDLMRQFAFTDFEEFGGANGVVRCKPFRPRAILARNRLAYCSLYRREVWATVGGYNPNMLSGYEDWDFWIGVAEHGLRGVHVPERLFRYRIRRGSRDAGAQRHDALLKARIVLNHPAMFPGRISKFAETILWEAEHGTREEQTRRWKGRKLDLWLAWHGRDAWKAVDVLLGGALGTVRERE